MEVEGGDVVNDSDILCGRGLAIMNHPGNNVLNCIINSKLDVYRDLKTYHPKVKLTKDVVQLLKQKHGARFLTEVRPTTTTGDGTSKVPASWIEVSDQEARIKVRIAFRDRPKIQQLHSNSVQRKQIKKQLEQCQLQYGSQLQYRSQFQSQFQPELSTVMPPPVMTTTISPTATTTIDTTTTTTTTYQKRWTKQEHNAFVRAIRRLNSGSQIQELNWKHISNYVTSRDENQTKWYGLSSFMGKRIHENNYWTIEEYDLLYNKVPHTWYYNRGYNKDKVRSSLIQKEKDSNKNKEKEFIISV